jgi:hypothetical protein
MLISQSECNLSFGQFRRFFLPSVEREPEKSSTEKEKEEKKKIGSSRKGSTAQLILVNKEE